MAFPSKNKYACGGVTLIFSFPSCAKLALASIARATARVKTYPIRRICLSPDDFCRRNERPLSAPGSDKRWLGLLRYFLNPTCVNNIERKKAKPWQTNLTATLSTIHSQTRGIILNAAREPSRIIGRG